jgi:methylmalonyl-CoA mutase
MYYEHLKHDGTLPLIGVNTFLPREHAGETATTIELIRSTETEKQQQIRNVEAYRAARNLPGDGVGGTTASSPGSLAHLQHTARARGNLFEALMEAVKCNSLGQISHALYEVGGEYRRNM